VTLVTGTDLLNGPLWSLRWEVIFSALLPLYVGFARVVPRATVLKIALMAVLIGVGVQTRHNSLIYLPVFGAGAALAGDLDRIRGLAAAMAGRRILPWVLLVIGLALADAGAITPLIGPDSHILLHRLSNNIDPALGATLLVLLAIVATPVRAACESKPVLWLGKQSFSLYLVHEPIVVSVALLLGRHSSAGLVVLIAVPLSLLASWGFQRLIEGPAHRLSQAVGRSVTARLSQPIPVELASAGVTGRVA
jgi:peptidoglycan/LPS O-acetylase OafA/YrhL